MTNLRKLLQDADPLQHEPTLSQAIAIPTSRRMPAFAPSRARTIRSQLAYVAVAVMLLAAAFLGARMWSPFVSGVQAAVRFEVRLAEEKTAPGLREAKAANSGQTVYLHDETIVTNSDIASTQVVPGGSPSQYRVSVQFTPSGAEKMRAATANHMGEPVRHPSGRRSCHGSHAPHHHRHIRRHHRQFFKGAGRKNGRRN